MLQKVMARLGPKVYLALRGVHAVRGELMGPGYGLVLTDEAKAAILTRLLGEPAKDEYRVRVFGGAERLALFVGRSLEPSSVNASFADLLFVETLPSRKRSFHGLGAVRSDPQPKASVVPFYDAVLPVKAQPFLDLIDNLWKEMFSGKARVVYELIDGTNWGHYFDKEDLIGLNLYRAAWSIKNTGSSARAILPLIHEARHRLQHQQPEIKLFSLEQARDIIRGREIFDDFAQSEGADPKEIDARIIVQRAFEEINAGAAFEKAVRVIRLSA